MCVAFLCFNCMLWAAHIPVSLNATATLLLRRARFRTIKLPEEVRMGTLPKVLPENGK